MDHWINQYYNEKENRWVAIDADGFYDENGMDLGQYDMTDENFDALMRIWSTKKKFRIMNSPLVGDYDNMGRFS